MASESASSARALADPERLMQLITAFMPSKILNCACKFGLFDLLESNEAKAQGGLTYLEIGTSLGLNTKVETGGDRTTRDFLDALVALKILDRTGKGTESRYRNTAEASRFLVSTSPGSLCGAVTSIFERHYKFWATMDEMLLTGQPQNETRSGKKTMFEKLAEDPRQLENFLYSMAAISRARDEDMAEKIDFSKYKTHLDLGGALGSMSVVLTAKHPHLKSTSFDLPASEAMAQKFLAENKAQDRVTLLSGDMFNDKLPKADVITAGNILHDWSLAKKKQILKAAFEALNQGGAFIALEQIVDDERRSHVCGLLMSLAMGIEYGAGNAFDYAFEEFCEWAKEIGFVRCEKVPLVAGYSAAVAHKV